MFKPPPTTHPNGGMRYCCRVLFRPGRVATATLLGVAITSTKLVANLISKSTEYDILNGTDEGNPYNGLRNLLFGLTPPLLNALAVGFSTRTMSTGTKCKAFGAYLLQTLINITINIGVYSGVVMPAFYSGTFVTKIVFRLIGKRSHHQIAGSPRSQ